MNRKRLHPNGLTKGSAHGKKPGMKALAVLFAVYSITCLGQQPNYVTDGINNGYLWSTCSKLEKKFYVTGIGDGVLLQTSVTASKAKANPQTKASIRKAF